MGRPKKKDKLHSTGRHVVKVKIGTNIDGTPIRKAFYSTKSKADAQKKADEYKKQLAISEVTGQFNNTKVGFTDYALKYLELMKGKVKDITYNLKYKNTFENHLMPYFKNVPIKAIKKMILKYT